MYNFLIFNAMNTLDMFVVLTRRIDKELSNVFITDFL